MHSTPLHTMADRVLGGRLDETLQNYADQGLSPGRMALRLAADYRVEVSSQTIKNWVKALAHDNPAGRSESAQATQTVRAVRTAQPAQTHRRNGSRAGLSR